MIRQFAQREGAMPRLVLAAAICAVAGRCAAAKDDTPAADTSAQRAAADEFYDQLKNDPDKLAARIRQQFEAIVEQTKELHSRLESADRVLRTMPRDEGEEAQRLRAELRQIRQQYFQLNRMLPAPAERVVLANRLFQLRSDIHKLRDAGQTADAEQLQRDALEVMAELVGIHPHRAPSKTHAETSQHSPAKATASPQQASSGKTEPGGPDDLRAELKRLQAEVDELRRQLAK